MDGLLELILSLHQGSQPLPEPVQAQARRLCLDTWACVLAGRQDPTVVTLEHTLSRQDSGRVCFPKGPGLSAGSSALLAATAACWDEACEGHAGAHGRPGVAVFAALFPLAHQYRLEDWLRAYTLGYEVGARAGSMLRIRTGMHVDGNWPALGAAAAVACLMGLTPTHIVQAVNAAACQLPMSLYWPVRHGANIRNTYLGHSAQLGHMAAMTTASGLQAPSDASSAYAQVALGLEHLQWPGFDHYEMMSAYIKPFAAVRHVHYGATCAHVLRTRLDPARIRTIRLRIYQEAVTYCGNRAPTVPLQAQFSLSFGLAAMMTHGRLDPSVYQPPLFNDPLLHQLESQVEIEVDAEWSARGQRGACLHITTDDGQTHTHEVTAVAGDANCPLSDEALINKYLAYAVPTLGQDLAKQHLQFWLEGSTNRPMSDIFPSAPLETV